MFPLSQPVKTNDTSRSHSNRPQGVDRPIPKCGEPGAAMVEYYMLFIVKSNGVPSVGSMIQVQE